MYRTPNSVPELASLPKAQREQIWRQVLKWNPRPWWHWLIYLGWMAAASYLLVIIIPSPHRALRALAMGLSAGFFAMVSTHHTESSDCFPKSANESAVSASTAATTSAPPLTDAQNAEQSRQAEPLTPPQNCDVAGTVPQKQRTRRTLSLPSHHSGQ
jgi:hypothetical protein